MSEATMTAEDLALIHRAASAYGRDVGAAHALEIVRDACEVTRDDGSVRVRLVAFDRDRLVTAAIYTERGGRLVPYVHERRPYRHCASTGSVYRDPEYFGGKP